MFSAPLGFFRATEEASSGQSLQLVRASNQFAYWNDDETALEGGELVIRFLAQLDTLPGSGEIYTFCAKWGSSGQRTLLFDVIEESGGYDIRALASDDGVADRSFVKWAYDTLAIDTPYTIEYRWDGAQASADDQWTLLVSSADQGTPIEQEDDAVSSIFSVEMNFAIGSRPDAVLTPSNSFDGRIDNFEYYSDLAETSQELNYLFDGDLTDGSGNGRDATGVNSPTFGQQI